MGRTLYPTAKYAPILLLTVGCGDPCLRSADDVGEVPVSGTEAEQAWTSSVLEAWAGAQWWVDLRLCSVEYVDEVLTDDGGVAGGQFHVSSSHIAVSRGSGSTALFHEIGHAFDYSHPDGTLSSDWPAEVDWSAEDVAIERFATMFAMGPLGISLQDDPVTRACMDPGAIAELDDVLAHAVLPDPTPWIQTPPSVVIDFPPDTTLESVTRSGDTLIISYSWEDGARLDLWIPRLSGEQGVAENGYYVEETRVSEREEFPLRTAGGFTAMAYLPDGRVGGILGLNRHFSLKVSDAYVIVDPDTGLGEVGAITCIEREVNALPFFFEDADGVWFGAIGPQRLDLMLVGPNPGVEVTPRRWRVPDVQLERYESLPWEAVAP